MRLLDSARIGLAALWPHGALRHQIDHLRPGKIMPHGVPPQDPGGVDRSECGSGHQQSRARGDRLQPAAEAAHAQCLMR